MSTKVGRNKYEEVKKIPVLDLVFTSSKKSLIDRVNDNGLQFTRNTIGTYVGADGLIKTAAAGEPRYTYDPETGEELGLLVEEARTNLQYPSIPVINILSTTVTANAAVAPDGTTTATFCEPNGVSTGIRSNASIVKTAEQKYAHTFYFKPNGYNVAGIDYGGGNPDTYAEAWIDVTTNLSYFSLPTNNASGFASIQSTPVGNGWYKIKAIQEIVIGGTTQIWSKTLSCRPDVPTGNNQSYTHTPGSGGYFWGHQEELGTFPTSYIPTAGFTVTRDPDLVTLTNTSIYDNEKFDIINDPFGMSAGSDTLTLLPSASNSSAIKRATIFSPNITQERINTFADKEDEFWRWRVTGDSFGLPQFSTDGQVTVDWDDGTVETLTTSDHTFTDGKAYHEIGFRLDSGTYMNILINSNAIHKDKVVAIGPAPESMVVNPFVGFKNCSNLVSFDPSLRLIELNSGQSATQAWLGCGKLKSFPLIDTSNITNFSNTWQGCTSLTSFPEINASNVTNFAGAWQICSSLTSFPEIDTSNGINFSSAWIGCSSLTSFPEIDTSSGTNFFAAWDNCTNLQSFPEINTSNGTDFRYAWAFCSSLTSFPTLDISNGTTFQFAWNRCVGLTDFPANFFDNWTGTPANNCFVTTWNDNFDLTATSVENIYNSISVSPSSSTPPASGTNIDVDYSIGTGTPDITVSAIDLTAKGWTPTLNGTAQTNSYSFASLDLDFATNKTLNDNISSSNLITFTRNSIGTYVDSNGVIQTAVADEPRFDHDPDTGESLGLLVEEARSNSTPYSNTPNTVFPSSAIYTQKYAGLAPDNKFTATKIVVTATQPNTGLRLTSWIGTTDNTRSIYVKTLTGGTVFFGQGGSGDQFLWDTSTLSYSSDIRHPTGSVEDVGNGWYRLTLGPYISSPGFPAGPANYFTPRDPGEYLIWGTQSEVGLFATSYIPTPATFISRASTATYYDANGVIQTAAIDEARDDAYLPDENGVFRPAGLLLEAASTNSYTYSNDLTQSIYSKNNVTLSVNTAVAPDGTTTATKVIPTTSSVVHSISRIGSLGLSSMRSVYVKAAGYNSCTVYDINTGARATIDLTTGTITNSNYFNFDIYFQARGRARNAGNGWWRIEVGYDSYSAANNPFHIYPNNDSTFAGDGISGILVWGYQQEADVYPNPTSYIPTAGSTVTRAADVSTSATVTRAADVASITGTNFSSWYNQDEGTFYSKGDLTYSYSGSNTFRTILLGGSFPSRRWSWAMIEAINTLSSATDGMNHGSFYTNMNINIPNNFNIAQAIKNTATTNVSSAADGVIKGSLTGFSSYTISSIQIGVNSFTGHLSRLTYWPKRLTDTSLQYLTQ